MVYQNHHLLAVSAITYVYLFFETIRCVKRVASENWHNIVMEPYFTLDLEDIWRAWV